MNALRILLTFALILYLTFYQFQFWKYFFLVVIPYYIITQVLMVDQSLNTPKKKSFIGMWSHPSDPQIYGTMKLNLNKVTEFLRQYSMKVEDKIGFTVFLVKLMGKIFEKYSQINGHVIFGRFIPKNSVDVSLMEGLEGGLETEMITVKGCEKLSLEEISKKIKEKEQALKDKTDKAHNTRLFFAKLLPTL